MPLLESALFAKMPTEDLHRLPTGKSHFRAFDQADWQFVNMAPHCSALYQHHCCLLQLMPLLEAALFANRGPAKAADRATSMGPFFTSTGNL